MFKTLGNIHLMVSFPCCYEFITFLVLFPRVFLWILGNNIFLNLNQFESSGIMKLPLSTDFCGEEILEKSDESIGGPDHVVEIDESKFG